jgi:hypothetical protein
MRAFDLGNLPYGTRGYRLSRFLIGPTSLVANSSVTSALVSLAKLGRLLSKGTLYTSTTLDASISSTLASVIG